MRKEGRREREIERERKRERSGKRRAFYESGGKEKERDKGNSTREGLSA